MEKKEIDGGEGRHDKEELRHLLNAVNEAARTARQGWIFFLSVLVYLGITALSISDKDILLNNPVTLPVLRVDVQSREIINMLIFHW